jgi:hypothetical protein
VSVCKVSKVAQTSDEEHLEKPAILIDSLGPPMCVSFLRSIWLGPSSTTTGNEQMALRSIGLMRGSWGRRGRARRGGGHTRPTGCGDRLTFMAMPYSLVGDLIALLSDKRVASEAMAGLRELWRKQHNPFYRAQRPSDLPLEPLFLPLTIAPLT